ncbi:hypothetical protein [Breznakiella homolactica]|uniref:Uncharacterized protein n=1 Tax=Breznakiella homolactica TaxID=2798577 RepID=A0A7T7XNH5_9SPIR|nr:hypothetical protein [Breznakiella homolactica]QQO09548.1 hypothetical protein JFL75_01095 [Breznakiella homolactica]
MAQNTALYPILRSFANKNHYPEINIEAFISFLEKYAKRAIPERPEWNRWAEDTSQRVWGELPSLVEDEKIQLLTDEFGTRIVMIHFYVDIIQQAYESPDSTADLPFPDEKSFKLSISEDQIRPISVEYDLSAYIDNPQETQLPIIKLTFPDGLGNTLILASMIPDTLLESAFLKIRNFLRSHNNKEYFQHKLAPSFQGKESQLREVLNQLLVKPFEALRIMKDAGDFSFLFWSYFANFVRSDIKKKKEQLLEETAALQSIYIIEVFNSYYKGKAVKRRESELAFKNLDLLLDKPPFMYTLDNVIKFTDKNGVPLLGQYTQEALEDFLKTKTTESKQDELPELLIVRGLQDERWFVKKTKMLPLCTRLLGDARPLIRKAISKRWLKILKEYQNEPAMESDAEFERLLLKYMTELAPALTALLEDQKLYLVYEELERTQSDIPETSRLYRNGVLIPLNELLLIRRKDTLTDTKILLPFWHSIPILTWLIGFFKNLGKRKQISRAMEQENQAAEDEIIPTKKITSQQHTLKAAAQDLKEQLVPEGETLDSYLQILQERWSRLLNAQAKQNLIEDVNALVRDRLRQILRIQKNSTLTEDTLHRMSNAIINDTPALQRLGSRESLTMYIEIYVIKLVLNIRF